MGSESISDMFQKHLIENANLHYGEFMKDLSRLIVSKNLCELLLTRMSFVNWMAHLIVWSNSP
jgi:hypothetical protein